MRLGFAVRVLGQPGLKSSDTRRWQNGPHLSVSLAYLRDILVYLRQINVRMYRASSNLAPYVTHPDLPRFHRQIGECAAELAVIGNQVRRDGLRLSFHLGPYNVLNSPDNSVTSRAAADIEAQAQILDAIGLGSEAVIVTHVGGLYDGHQTALDRFVKAYARLSNSARARLVLENDDRAFSIRDTHYIHQHTGIRLVFDHLHYRCNPTPGMSVTEALALALSTWPPDETPKVHFSSPRTNIVQSSRTDAFGVKHPTAREPRVTQHADLIDPFAFIDLLRSTADLRPFDVMLECKAQDVALLRLRRHLQRYAPDLVTRHEIV